MRLGRGFGARLLRLGPEEWLTCDICWLVLCVSHGTCAIVVTCAPPPHLVICRCLLSLLFFLSLSYFINKGYFVISELCPCCPELGGVIIISQLCGYL